MTMTGFYNSGGVPDNATFGTSLAGAPVNAYDNDTFVVTGDGLPSGEVLEVYKYDEESASWIDITAPDDNLTFSKSPAIFPLAANDNDTHIVTDNGLPTGDPLETWKYDKESNQWVLLASGEDCPDPMPRSALLSLRNSGKLKPACHYIITDYTRANVGAATIMLHAIDEKTLSMDADVKTGFDDAAWSGRYDIDTNRLEFLADNIGNEVSGRDSVDSFLWGNSLVSQNRVYESRMLITAGSTVRRNDVFGGATVTISAGSFQTNSVGQAANVTVSGGSVYDNSFDRDTTSTFKSGSNFENNFGAASTYTQVGTGFIRASRVDTESTVTNGNTNILETVFERTVVNTSGSAGSIYYSRMSRSTVTAQNVPSFTIQSCDFRGNSQVSATGAKRAYYVYVDMSMYGRILQSADTQLDVAYTSVSDYAYIQIIKGRMYCSYCSISNVSYIQHNSTGTNRIERTTVMSQSNARFLGESTNCRIYYCQISSGGTVYHNGTSKACYFYYCEISTSSSMYSQNSVNLRGYYNTLSGNSQYYSSNVSGTHYAYYNALNGHGYLRHYNSAGGRLYAVHCSGQGLVQFYGASTAAGLLYSSFHAYFYLYAANWTVQRYALHGYGRRSYTVTNPPNGTYQQNF